MVFAIFFVFLLLGFLMNLYILRATETEKALRRQLAGIAEPGVAGEVATTILKEDRLSPVPWMHDLLSRVKPSTVIVTMIRQAGLDWWVSSAVLGAVEPTCWVTVAVTTCGLFTSFTAVSGLTEMLADGWALANW